MIEFNLFFQTVSGIAFPMLYFGSYCSKKVLFFYGWQPANVEQRATLARSQSTFSESNPYIHVFTGPFSIIHFFIIQYPLSTIFGTWKKLYTLYSEKFVLVECYIVNATGTNFTNKSPISKILLDEILMIKTSAIIWG